MDLFLYKLELKIKIAILLVYKAFLLSLAYVLYGKEVYKYLKKHENDL